MGQLLPFDAAIPVFVVDDDSTVRDALSLLLRLEGFDPIVFGDGASFMEAVRAAPPACIVLDLHLPDGSGLDLLRELAALRVESPIVVISGQSDIATAVAAMKFGALDFVEKPFSGRAMVEQVRTAVAAWRTATKADFGGLADFSGRHLLTCRERDVLARVASGASNKETGRLLGISPRTVEVHRARIMEKLGAKNAADLMRIVLSDAGRRAAQ